MDWQLKLPKIGDVKNNVTESCQIVNEALDHKVLNPQVIDLWNTNIVHPDTMRFIKETKINKWWTHTYQLSGVKTKQNNTCIVGGWALVWCSQLEADWKTWPAGHNHYQQTGSRQGRPPCPPLVCLSVSSLHCPLMSCELGRQVQHNISREKMKN